MTKEGMTNFDLEERTAKFGEEVLIFCKKIEKDIYTTPLVSQLIRSATSIGANYCEADEAESKKDFRHKISISKKEARETRHWLRMIAKICPEFKKELRILWQEAKELSLIFNAIINSSKSKK